MNNSHILWAIKSLNDCGYQIHTSIPETIQNTPWSEVTRFETNQGFIFLKKMPPALSLEPNIINILDKKFHANVPKIIASNHEYHCFLMQAPCFRKVVASEFN